MITDRHALVDVLIVIHSLAQLERSVIPSCRSFLFVANAKPDILEKEYTKRQDAEAKIKALEEGLGRLN